MSATLTTLRLSFGSKEQASLEGEAQAFTGTGALQAAGPEALGWGGLGGWSVTSRELEVLNPHLWVFLPSWTQNSPSMKRPHSSL